MIYIQLDEEGEDEIEGEDDAEPAGEAAEQVEEEEEAEEEEEEGSGKREDPNFDTFIFPKLRSADQEDIKLETDLNQE